MKERLDKTLSSKKFMITLSFIGLYLFSAGTSWAIFSYIKGEPAIVSQDLSGSRSKIDPNLPKTEECPINGKMYSEPERAIWEERRPITAIIENHLDSRPQSGLSKADVVYEAVAEGGITRYLAIFYCGASADNITIAPIRSVRVYFIDWAAEYGKEPLFVHIGGANNICKHCPGGVKPWGQIASTVDAFKMLIKLGWRSGVYGNDFDGGTNVGAPIIVRNQYRLGEKALWEHSVEGYTDKIFDEGGKRGFAYKNEEGDAWIDDFTVWKFADDSVLSTPKTDAISFEFWSNKGDYDITWKYDAGGNKYLRFNGGKEHMDHETEEQLSAKNIVIMFVKEKGPIDEEGHMFYTTTGTGDALIFQNGDVIEATWEKAKQLSRTVFYDENDEEISFVRGEIWIEAVPAGNNINY